MNKKEIEQAKKSIKHGKSWPYHTPDKGARKPNLNGFSEIAAAGVLADLLDRRGIKWALEDVDHATRKEIFNSLKNIIEVAFAQA